MDPKTIYNTAQHNIKGQWEDIAFKYSISSIHLYAGVRLSPLPSPSRDSNCIFAVGLQFMWFILIFSPS